jgi:hypothetical protein
VGDGAGQYRHNHHWTTASTRRQDQKSRLYGRALVVIAAEQYASRLVVPASQQFHPKRWPSHKDQAAKALRELAGPHIPVTLKQLDKAVAAAKREHDRAQEQARTQQRRRASKPDTPATEAREPRGEPNAEVDEQLNDGAPAAHDPDGEEPDVELEADGEVYSDTDAGR